MHKVFEAKYEDMLMQSEIESKSYTNSFFKTADITPTIPYRKCESGNKSDKIMKLAQMLEQKLYKTEPVNNIDIFDLDVMGENDKILQMTLAKPVIKKNKISRSSLKILF
jgi:hypothetical protein